MSVSVAFMLMLIKFTPVVIAAIEWKLAFNIHASDGHSFDYNEHAWEDDTDVGKDLNAFRADYKKYDVTLETVNFIALVRHQDGICEAARVWEFLTYGKTLQNYLDRKNSMRVLPTFNNYTYSYISKNMLSVNWDPIFSADGGLAFNWEYRDNGVRISNTGTYRPGGMPGKTSGADDELKGLGNTFQITTKSYWFDVGVNHGDCTQCRLTVQGTDHGPHLKDGTLHGQYAIFISDAAETFPCKDQQLQIEMSVPTQEPTYDPTTRTQLEFDLIDRNYDGFINYAEFAFHIADVNSDDLLSFEEYEAAIRNILND